MGHKTRPKLSPLKNRERERNCGQRRENGAGGKGTEKSLKPHVEDSHVDFILFFKIKDLLLRGRITSPVGA